MLEPIKKDDLEKIIYQIASNPNSFHTDKVKAIVGLVNHLNSMSEKEFYSKSATTLENIEMNEKADKLMSEGEDSPKNAKNGLIEATSDHFSPKPESLAKQFKDQFLIQGDPFLTDAVIHWWLKKVSQARAEEHQFFLNILDGIDTADEQMGNKGGGTKAIRLALKSRSIT